MSDLTDAATNVAERTVGDDRVIDFDIDVNEDYEIQSSVVVDESGRVVEAAVRFGRIEQRPDLGIDQQLQSMAWKRMVADIADAEAVEADLSDFDHVVPHLRIERPNVEEYGLETLTLDEFVAAVVELSAEVERVFRADARHADRIDEWL